MIYIVDGDAYAGRCLAMRLSIAGMPPKLYVDTDAFLRDFDPERAGVILLGVHTTDQRELRLLDCLSPLSASQAAVVVADIGSVALCRQAFKAGASEFFERPVDNEEIVAVLQQLLRTRLHQHARQVVKQRASERYARLSLREREVLAMIVTGATNRSVAKALQISARTVEVHRARLIAKLEVANLAQMVRYYADLVEMNEIQDQYFEPSRSIPEEAPRRLDVLRGGPRCTGQGASKNGLRRLQPR